MLQEEMQPKKLVKQLTMVIIFPECCYSDYYVTLINEVLPAVFSVAKLLLALINHGQQQNGHISCQ